MNKRKFSEQEEIEYQCDLETMLENEEEERERDAIRAKYDRAWYSVSTKNSRLSKISKNKSL